jgi:phosphopantothenoylcysteine decarboxylase/phosphopantothenate--cysteine ligase
MNHVMWANPAVQANRATLEERGFKIIGPDIGSQACGETGAGRMTDPQEIAAELTAPAFTGTGDALLAGKTVLITAGPTREPIDPVRYITNRSSGKMGYAMASAAAEQGARVILVSGPVSIAAPQAVEVHNVETAEEMFKATHDNIEGVDVFIGAAAVADYRPADLAEQKIKKNESTMRIDLVRSRDILASVAALKDAPFTVGFAAETENLREYALGKLQKKKLDMIMANRVGRDRGFDYDENKVCVYTADGHQTFPMTAKKELARDLIRVVAERYQQEKPKKDNVVALH